MLEISMQRPCTENYDECPAALILSVCMEIHVGTIMEIDV